MANKGYAGSKTTKLLLLDSLLQEIEMSVVARSLLRLRSTNNLNQVRTMANKGYAGNLPNFDPAAAIPMKCGAVYMGVFMGFWGLCFMVSPFQERSTMTDTFEKKWQNK